MPAVAAICGACQADLRRALHAVPDVVRDLDLTLSRQTSKTGNGGRSSVVPLAFDARASEAGYVLRNTLVGWVRMLVEREPDDIWPADTPSFMAAWISVRLSRLIVHPAAQEACEEITAAVAEAERVVDRRPDRVYVGPCGADLDDGPCPRDLYAPPGARVVRCPACDTEWNVARRREELLGKVVDQLAGAVQAAHILTHLAAPLRASTVRKWGERGRLVSHGTDPHGHPLYRVGDVLDLLVAKLERDERLRAKREAERAAAGQERMAS